MSAGAVLQAAALAALRAAGVAAFDFPPVRAALPHAVVGDPLIADRSAAGASVREARLSVVLHDDGEVPARLRALMPGAEAAVEQLPEVLDEGWRLVALALLRSRVTRSGDRWTGSIEFRATMLRAN